MRCPFCGNEMTPGGLYLTTHPLHPDPIRWVPQAEDRDTGYAPWGSREAIPMVGSLEDEAARREKAEAEKAEASALKKLEAAEAAAAAK